MSRTEVLHVMDRQRALLRDARAYTVGTLYLLRPDPARPDAPVLELIGFGRVTAIVDHDTVQ